MSNFKFDLQRFSVKTFTNQGQLVNLVTLDDIYEVSGGKEVYGFKIRKAESDPTTRVEYTDNAVGKEPLRVDLSTGVCNYGDWKDSFIIASFKPCALSYDGKVDYYLDPNNHIYKEDGSYSDIYDKDATTIFNYNGNFMVQVRKMWFCCYEDDEYQYCKVASYKVNDNYYCYAHINDAGEEVPYIYLPMFEGSTDSSSRLRSVPYATPTYSQTGATEIIRAKNNGDRWYTDDFINSKMIENLTILLTKSCHSQATIGTGFTCGSWNNKWEGQTPGTMMDKGMFYGTSNNTVSTMTGVKLFYLENYYGSRWDRIAGCINNKGTWYIKPTRPYFNDSLVGYVNTHLSVPSASGSYQSAHTMTKYGLLPKTCSGSETTYIPDGMWSNNSQVDYGLRGGRWYIGSRCGVSCLDVDIVFSLSYASYGASPCYK